MWLISVFLLKNVANFDFSIEKFCWLRFFYRKFLLISKFRKMWPDWIFLLKNVVGLILFFWKMWPNWTFLEKCRRIQFLYRKMCPHLIFYRKMLWISFFSIEKCCWFWFFYRKIVADFNFSIGKCGQIEFFYRKMCPDWIVFIEKFCRIEIFCRKMWPYYIFL